MRLLKSDGTPVPLMSKAFDTLVVLVENRDSYNISLVREHTKNIPQTLRRLAAVTGAADTGVDVFATDHCPFRREDKDDYDRDDIRTVANGLAGLGALPHLVWKLFEEEPDRAASELALRVSGNPARRAGIGDRKGRLAAGFDADLVEWNPEAEFVVDRSMLHDRHKLTPYAGMTLCGVVEATTAILRRRRRSSFKPPHS